jgi:hypothetical protein
LGIEKRKGTFTLTIKERVVAGKKNWWMTDGSSTNFYVKREVVPQPPPFSNKGVGGWKGGNQKPSADSQT